MKSTTNLADEAFCELFPNKDSTSYDFSVTYSGRFKPYNGHVKYRGKWMEFNLSKEWRKISKEIQMGFIQVLLLRVFKQKKETMHIDLYNNFLKNVHVAIPKNKVDDFLLISFNRVNDEYFHGLLDMPNLVWHTAVNRLGSYAYGGDTISISRILHSDLDALDYVMYHEMLHKHFKFECKNGRTHHHTPAFKKREREFRDWEAMEKRLKEIVHHNSKKRFRWF